ncbi:hypothetical protein CCHR01_03633 [Colletotrichum chrysophilum]|uniref:Uncharacterized protein n=1 Tax=Colletotrichum chrysophilum TaxID=1836956 RepID=A0AAD9EM97_9PEZI|nr:hypothetical protein CCHR01_03633 [Colletotrichum chrysophilum]
MACRIELDRLGRHESGPNDLLFSANFAPGYLKPNFLFIWTLNSGFWGFVKSSSSTSTAIDVPHATSNAIARTHITARMSVPAWMLPSYLKLHTTRGHSGTVSYGLRFMRNWTVTIDDD